MTVPDLSIIVPVFNEEAVVPEFARVLVETLTPTGLTFETVFVNDGSSDGTAQRLESLRQGDARVKVIEFSRNFGHQSAMTAGLRAAKGRACVIMDADLQDPPALLVTMVEKWREGYEVVYAVRRSREGETVFKKVTAALFYRTLRALAGVDIPPDTGDFRLMDRRVVDVLNAFPERNRFLRGLVSWIGFRQIGVSFDRPPPGGGGNQIFHVENGPVRPGRAHRFFTGAVEAGDHGGGHGVSRQRGSFGLGFMGSVVYGPERSRVDLVDRHHPAPGWRSTVGPRSDRRIHRPYF